MLQVSDMPKAKEITEEDINRKEAERRARKSAETIHHLWNISGVRKRHRNPMPVGKGPWDKKYIELSKKLKTGYLVALVGVRGCGKSQLGAELIKNACMLEQIALYTTAMDVFVELRDGYKLNASEQAILARYKRPQLLVIDETQERGETPWEDRLLTMLIDYRYSQMRDTVLISNQTREQFESSMGASVVSRMVETGGIVDCDWPSFRGVKA